MKQLYVYALQALLVIGFLILLPIAASSSWICSRLETKIHKLRDREKEML